MEKLRGEGYGVTVESMSYGEATYGYSKNRYL